jgi:hypothetical protein
MIPAVARSDDAVADPPEAEGGEQRRQPDEDSGLRPLQRPEVAAGVIEDVLPQAEGAKPLLALVRAAGGAAFREVGGAGEGGSVAVDRAIGDGPGAVDLLVPAAVVSAEPYRLSWIVMA